MGKNLETVKDFTFLRSKSLWTMTAATKLKMLAPWKKSYDKPKQHIKKQRQIALPTKVCIVKAMVFPVVKYGCES